MTSDDVKPYTREELEAFEAKVKEIGTEGIEREWLRRPEGDTTPFWLDRLLVTARVGLEDTARLDWLDSQTPFKALGYSQAHGWEMDTRASNVRAAIDVARGVA